MMETLAALFETGRVIDVILVFVVVEAVALLLWRRHRGVGPGLASVVALLLPGVFLMLALRLALTGVAWPGIAACLLLALVAHVWDVARRLRRDG